MNTPKKPKMAPMLALGARGRGAGWHGEGGDMNASAPLSEAGGGVHPATPFQLSRS
jgi:hypothetical protein